MTLAETVKHYQDLNNLTTQEFASKSNLPVDTINKIRSGATQNPSMDTLKRMASALGCSIDQLADMPVSELDTSKLLPNMQQDFGGIAADFCGTLHRQQMAHDHAIREVRKDRKWWRIAALTMLGIVIILIIIQTLLLVRLYWDLSNPFGGSITYP